MSVLMNFHVFFNILLLRDCGRIQDSQDTPNQVDSFAFIKTHDRVFGVQGMQPVIIVVLDISFIANNKGTCFAFGQIRRIRDLNGSRVGVIHDPAVLAAVRSSEKLTKHASGATEYLSLGRCINALDNGWCAAVAMDSLMLSYYRDA